MVVLVVGIMLNIWIIIKLFKINKDKTITEDELIIMVEEAENERIKAEADAKAAEAAANAPKVEEEAPKTIDDVVEEAKNEKE